MLTTEPWQQRRKRLFQLEKREVSRRKEQLKSSTGHVRRGPTEYTYNGTRYYHDEGMRYEGDLHARDGRLPNPHGNGTLYNKRGVNIYMGGWQQGEKHGDGSMFYTNGCPDYEGYFEHDNFLEGKIYRENGEVEYDGKISNWAPDDEGTFFFPDGRTKYTGSFVNGFFDGDGIEYTRCGKMDHTLSGIWEKGTLKKILSEEIVPRDHEQWVNIDPPSNNSNWPTCLDDVVLVIQDAWILYRERAQERRTKVRKALRRRFLPVDYMEFNSSDNVDTMESGEDDTVAGEQEEVVAESDNALKALLGTAAEEGQVVEDEEATVVVDEPIADEEVVAENEEVAEAEEMVGADTEEVADGEEVAMDEPVADSDNDVEEEENVKKAVKTKAVVDGGRDEENNDWGLV